MGRIRDAFDALRGKTPGINASTWYSVADSAAMAEIFALPQGATGEPVTATSAMRVSAVYASVRLLAGSIAQLPIKLYRERGEQRAEPPKGPLWWLLNEQVNPRWSTAAFWEYITSSMLLRGDGFAAVVRRGSERPDAGARGPDASELWPLNPESVNVIREGNRLRYYFTEDGVSYGLDQDDVLHFPGFGFDGRRSQSVISWGALNAIGIAAAADRHSGAFYKGGAPSRYVLRAPGKLSPEQKDSLRTQFVDRYGGPGGAEKPIVLAEGLDVSTISMSAVDAQLLEARRFQVEDIARAFGVPPFMIGDTSNTSSWGTGVEVMGRGFLMFTLQPHLRRFEMELNRKLFRNAGRYLAFDTAAFSRADQKTRFDSYRSAIGGSAGPGWMTRDEVRQAENLPPAGGDAAELYLPTAPAPGPETAPEDDPNDTEAPEAPDTPNEDTDEEPTE
jgi:HK97 family phage portal protein